MVVYVDLIFLLNLLINLATLKTTAWIRKTRMTHWRALSAALLGALYVVMMFFPVLSFLFTFIIKCIISVLMIFTAFGFGSLQHFLRNFGVFYLVNFAAAGGIFALHYFMQSSHEVMNGILFTQSGGLRFELKIGGLFVLFSFPFMISFYRKIFRSEKTRAEMSTYLAEAEVYIGEHYSICMGLIDTGNQLYDPLTRTPVMIMEASQWKDVIPDSWMKRIEADSSEQIVEVVGKEDFIWQDRLRIVPFKGIQNGTQFMLAVKPDKVVINQQDERFEETKVLIGLKGSKLCSDGSYQAIIHPALTKIHRR